MGVPLRQTCTAHIENGLSKNKYWLWLLLDDDDTVSSGVSGKEFPCHDKCLLTELAEQIAYDYGFLCTETILRLE